MSRKKIVIILAILAVLIIAGAVYFMVKKQRQLFLLRQAEEEQERLIDNLTAPLGAAVPISSELEKKITAPGGSKINDNILKDILESLTAPSTQ